ncbi:pyridoxamine 5'-phosphate oxidase-domain-containing protein [Fomitopsis serialis]|uniref:pyridoxamine 5'-phosphate oxidase-domain-containing protein n=1 Tax=Fomitopsis serialis TaxID=139415 RepID=UPI002008670A|nr:pyridoxamine 5'-phosphate oxidase-domain-containing protein [Neoantrodia serialis]KAH9935299.1 pyridoxamine 5'-phosphate oxidase-domain-containing protein [Neoantrodia serialis]
MLTIVSAILARSLVDLSPSSIGYMGTVFPDDHATLAGQPFSLQEYYASCHANGSLVLLFMPISRSSQNILHSNTRSVSISVADAQPDASRPRVSLIGNVTVFTDAACYIAKHPDAHRWVPGPGDLMWCAIYYVGGFGDLHYIGYIPLGMYQGAGPSGNVAEVDTPLVVQST